MKSVTLLLFLQFISIEATTISNFYNIIKNNELSQNFNSALISTAFLSSKINCAFKCTQNENCTAAIFSKDSSECKLYSIPRRLYLNDFISNLPKVILTKKGNFLLFSL